MSLSAHWRAPGGCSEIALKWESNCQVETAHRYGWCASSKTIHLADNRTGSHSRNASQSQRQWVTNCVLMGLLRKEVWKYRLLLDFLFHSSTWCKVGIVFHVAEEPWEVSHFILIKGFHNAFTACAIGTFESVSCAREFSHAGRIPRQLASEKAHLLTLLNVLLSTLRTISCCSSSRVISRVSSSERARPLLPLVPACSARSMKSCCYVLSSQKPDCLPDAHWPGEGWGSKVTVTHTSRLIIFPQRPGLDVAWLQ